MEIEGVSYYNDSKATTAESVSAAVEGFNDTTVHLILGGKDKGADFTSLRDILKSKCQKIYVIGEAQKRILTELNLPIAEPSSSLDEALFSASKNALSGESVLLSPACSSFDSFTSFVARGNHFKALVKELCHG